MRVPGTILSALTLLEPAAASAHPTPADDAPVSSRSSIKRTIPARHRHTAVRLVAPRAGSVLVYEDGALVARVDGRDTILLPTGRTYDLVAFGSGHVLWRGEVAATTDRMDVVWKDGNRSPVVERWLDPDRRQHPTGDFPHAGRAPMDPDAFHILADNLREERTDVARVEMIREVAARNTLSVAQLGTILRTLRFESNRLWATEALRTRIVDPGRAEGLLPLFDFEASRARVRAIFRDWS